MFITRPSLGELWLSYMSHIVQNGSSVPDDREEILETGPVCCEVAHIDGEDPIIKRYADKTIIELYVKKMYAMELMPEFNSSYGDRLFNYDGVNQIQWLIEKLAKNQFAKSAAISLLKPQDTAPRIPCLVGLQPVLRHSTLTLNATFRSQNAFRAYGNFFGLSAILNEMAVALRVEPGSIRAFVVCPHIYRSDIKDAKEIINAATQGKAVYNVCL